MNAFLTLLQSAAAAETASTPTAVDGWGDGVWFAVGSLLSLAASGVAALVTRRADAARLADERRRWTDELQDRKEERELSEAAARRREIERRSDAAAEKSVEELQTVRDLYRGRGPGEAHPDIGPNLRNLHRYRLAVGRSDARAQLDHVLKLLGKVPLLQQQGRGDADDITRRLCREGAETLGAVLRAEPLPPLSSEVQGYLRTVAQYREGMEQLAEGRHRAEAAGQLQPPS